MGLEDLHNVFSDIGNKGLTFVPAPEPLIPIWLLLAALLLFIFAVLVIAYQVIAPIFIAVNTIIPIGSGFSLVAVLNTAYLLADYFLAFVLLGTLCYMAYNDYRHPSGWRALKYGIIAVLLGWFYTVGLQALNPIVTGFYRGELNVFYSVLASGFFIFALYVALIIGIWINVRSPYANYH